MAGEAGGPAARVCSNGHTVSEDYLKVCPRCGVHLATVASAARPPSLAPDAPAVVVPKTIPFVVGGVLLGLFGLLLVKGAERGPAEAFAWVILVAAALVVGAGLLDGVRRRR